MGTLTLVANIVTGFGGVYVLWSAWEELLQPVIDWKDVMLGVGVGGVLLLSSLPY